MKKYLYISLVLLFQKVNAQKIKKGKASYYGDAFHNKQTADGSWFNKHLMTCAASNDYSFGDSLLVTNVDNNKKVIVVVNDRGGFKKYNRVLDLSEGAFKKIESLKKGVITVTIEKINNLKHYADTIKDSTNKLRNKND